MFRYLVAYAAFALIASANALPNLERLQGLWDMGFRETSAYLLYDTNLQKVVDGGCMAQNWDIVEAAYSETSHQLLTEQAALRYDIEQLVVEGDDESLTFSYTVPQAQLNDNELVIAGLERFLNGFNATFTDSGDGVIEYDTPFALNGEAWYTRKQNGGKGCILLGNVTVEPDIELVTLTLFEQFTLEVDNGKVTRIDRGACPEVPEVWCRDSRDAVGLAPTGRKLMESMDQSSFTLSQVVMSVVSCDSGPACEELLSEAEA